MIAVCFPRIDFYTIRDFHEYGDVTAPEGAGSSRESLFGILYGMSMTIVTSSVSITTRNPRSDVRWRSERFSHLQPRRFRICRESEMSRQIRTSRLPAFPNSLRIRSHYISNRFSESWDRCVRSRRQLKETMILHRHHPHQGFWHPEQSSLELVRFTGWHLAPTPDERSR